MPIGENEFEDINEFDDIQRVSDEDRFTNISIV